MTTENELLVELFDRCSELPLQARRAVVDEYRARFPALAAELESLLQAHDTPLGFVDHLDSLQAAGLLQEDEVLLMPERAGAFRLIREIGRGGIGVVYLGERDDGDFDQQVAVKLVKRGMDSDLILRRFRNERRILASLDHPNISRLIDGGLLENGRPYFAMEYIRGTRITDWCDRRRLPLEERLRLFEQVCRTVQYAHARLIVHRDLKPANILVTDEDAGHRPGASSYTVKLLDFGIAKLLDEAEGSDMSLTIAGMRAMTRHYAAPEQIRGEPVSAATDVYALGLVLYELLTGQHPYRDKAESAEALARTICEISPAAPSTAAAGTDLETARARGCRPNALRRCLLGDLDTIVLTALAMEPQRRYGSAEALAEDISRFMDGLPIKARRDTVAYRSSRFISRHRMGVAAAAAITLTLIGGMVMTAWQAQEAREQAENALRTRDFVVSLLSDANPSGTEKGAELTAVELLQRSVARVESELDHTPGLQAELRQVLANALLTMGDLHAAAAVAERGVEQFRKLYGSDSAQFADGLYTLARIRVRLGPLDQAEVLARESLAIRDRLVSGPDLRRARMLGLLASVNNQRGRHSEAMILYQQALAERIELGGEDDPSLAVAYHNLASTAIHADRYPEAETGYRKAQALQLAHAGPDHPRMANIHLGLGVALIGLGRLEEAEDELIKALDIGTRRQGPHSETVVTSHYQLGEVRRQQGRLSEGRTYFSESAKAAEVSGQLNVQLTAQARLGLTLLAEGLSGQAAAILTDTESMMAVHFPDRPLLGLTRVALGLAQSQEGQAQAGRMLAESAMADLLRTGQHQGLIYAEACGLYAELLLVWDERTTAREWLERAVFIFSQMLGDTHPQTERHRDKLAGLPD